MAMAPRKSRPLPPPAASRATRTEAVAGRLHSAAIHLLRRLRTTDEATGLSGPAASALSVVVFGGPITLGALAAAEQVRPPTITRLVRDLETAALVRREADPADGRIQRVRATRKGRRILEAGRARRVAALTAALERLPAAELRALEAAVHVLEGIVRTPGVAR
jgi:DNA-binding MarR family transcriptional regulator